MPTGFNNTKQVISHLKESVGDWSVPPPHGESFQNPLLLSATEDSPYTPTYQFPASTPSPKSEGN